MEAAAGHPLNLGFRLSVAQPLPKLLPPQVLLAHLPVETTALLMELCLQQQQGQQEQAQQQQAFTASMADFTHLFTDR